jgi:outer membrane protein OmpA-like peptidoglycan-associated protein
MPGCHERVNGCKRHLLLNIIFIMRSSDEVNIQGFGETHPLLVTGAGVREPQNRRVEIVIR